MTRSKIIFCTCLIISCLKMQAQSGEHLFDHTVMHELRLYFEDDNFWNTLTQNYETYIDDSGVEVPYLRAILEVDGYIMDTIGVRQKGLSSHFASTELKKPLKLDFNEFTEGQSYDGIKKINLHNGAADPGMLRDFIAYNTLRTAGVKAPRVAHCKLYLNDEYWGVYSIIEQVDKTFLENNFADASGTLIKNIGWSELHWAGSNPLIYQEDFQLKTNEEEADWTDFIQFMDALNNTSDAIFPAAIDHVLDVDGFLHVLAVDVMTNNWDSYIDNERNWYLYHNTASGKFHWIPWDYNLSMGGTFSRSGNPFPPFDTACFVFPEFKFIRDNGEIHFIDDTYPEAEFWHWDLGDGAISDEENPMHTYDSQGVINVCLTSGRMNNGQLCEQTRCHKIDLSFDPFACNSIQNGSSPYLANDPIYQQVIEEDNYCCEGSWDALCSFQYYEIQTGADSFSLDDLGVSYDLDFPIVLNNPNKVLVERLMNVPAYRQRYLDICCLLLEQNFNAERLFPLIDQQANLIREGIYEDPNYNFTLNYFEYDVGNGTGGGNGAKIPALKWVLNQRFEAIANDLDELGQDCNDAFAMFGWQDVTINEFLASNNENSNLPDPVGEYDDWVELYNNTTEPIDLTGYYLTDDIDEPKQWTFPLGTIISPNDYLIIWIDNDEAQLGLHANFKLSKNGDFMMLVHEDGTVIDSLTFGPQSTNIASARIPNGVGDWKQQYPTFNINNELVNSTLEVYGKETFKVFPNPAHDYFFLQFDNAIISDQTVRLRNILGLIVWEKMVGSVEKWQVSTSNLSPGIYVVEVENKNRILTKKIRIE